MSVSGFSQNDRKTAAIRASNQHEEDVDPARSWDEELLWKSWKSWNCLCYEDETISRVRGFYLDDKRVVQLFLNLFYHFIEFRGEKEKKIQRILFANVSLVFPFQKYVQFSIFASFFLQNRQNPFLKNFIR